jgi:hypothetical protein
MGRPGGRGTERGAGRRGEVSGDIVMRTDATTTTTITTATTTYLEKTQHDGGVDGNDGKGEKCEKELGTELPELWRCC